MLDLPAFRTEGLPSFVPPARRATVTRHRRCDGPCPGARGPARGALPRGLLRKCGITPNTRRDTTAPRPFRKNMWNCSNSREPIMTNGVFGDILLLAFVLAAFTVPAASFTLLPAKFTLDGPAAEQRLVLELADGKTLLGQVTNGVAFTSSNPNVVRIEGGLAIAAGNGTATITGKSGRSSAKAEVRVVNMDRPFEWNFRNHIQPVLTKTGCNSGACHGAAAGQGGFKLSLRGYDDDGDHRAITRSALGRRGAGAQPPAHQAHHRRPAQGRRALHHQLARLPHPRRVDSEWHPCPAGRRGAHRESRGAPRASDAETRRPAATTRARDVLERRVPRRDALREVHQREQCRLHRE